MTKQAILGLVLGVPITIVLLGFLFLQGTNVAVLNPQGDIASQQRDLMIIATLLMLIVVVPVFILTAHIAWKYRASNKKATYKPDEDGNKVIEVIWWTIPLIIIVILSGIIWRTSHSLDPFKPIASQTKPITIQVVSMEWKWLFIYPDQGIASVNYLRIPEDTPINFELTSDAPMNSFWIPQLGGQIYTMAGMQTRLHLIAENPGEYVGQSANLSGEGFSGMKFTAEATSYNDFNGWVSAIKGSASQLDQSTYNELAKKSEDVPVKFFALSDKDIFQNTINKYMRTPDGTKAKHNGHGE